MNEQLTRIELKLDVLKADVHSIKVLDAVQNEQLASHIKRTELLEKRFDSLPQKLLVVISLIGGVVTVARVLIQ